MAAAKLNLPVIEKGATFRHSLDLVNPDGSLIDLTGCTAKIDVRENIEDATALISLSTENGRIVIEKSNPAVAGKDRVSLYISAADTTALKAIGGVYDLEIYYPNGDVVRLVAGNWSFSDEVTRA